MKKITMNTINSARWDMHEKHKKYPGDCVLCRAAIAEHLETGRPISKEVYKLGTPKSYGGLTPFKELNTLKNFIITGEYTKKDSDQCTQ